MTYRVAVLGATGLVGRTTLELLEARDFPVAEPVLLASDRGGARELSFRGRAIPVQAVSAAAFAGVDFALFASANAVSQHWAGPAQAAGSCVVDCSSAFRYDDRVPLVVPEVNGALLEARPTLIANPNCSTIAIVLALAPLARAAGIERVVISTYQSVSGGGSQTLDELEAGIRGGLEGPPPPRPGGLPAFAYNVVPHIDRFEANGYTREEMKIVWETRKILGLPDLAVTATAVRVPVRVGHAAAINVVLRRVLDPNEARALWAATPGLIVVDEPAAGRYPMPLDAAGRDEVLVGRARHDVSHPRGLEFFVASDNLRKGAALNAVQIAESLVRAGASPAVSAARSPALGPLLLGALAGSLVSGRFETVLGCLALGLAMSAWAGAPLPSGRWSLSLAIAAGLALVLNVLLVRGTALLPLPEPLHASREGLSAGALLALRLVGAAVALHGLRAAWPGERAADELAARVKFLERVRVPVRTARAVVGLALRFAPLVGAEAQRIAALQDHRAGGPPLGRREWMQRRRAMLMPLLGCTLERAERVALAMEARHYRVRPVANVERAWLAELGGLVVAGVALAWRR